MPRSRRSDSAAIAPYSHGMSGVALTLADVDLENDVFAERFPHETFALLRREAPVHWYDWKGGRGFWCITKHEDVVAVSRDTKTFSSEVGGANLEDLDEDARLVRQSMLETDPPRHTRLRGLVGAPFTPRAVARTRARSAS